MGSTSAKHLERAGKKASECPEPQRTKPLVDSRRAQRVRIAEVYKTRPQIPAAAAAEGVWRALWPCDSCGCQVPSRARVVGGRSGGFVEEEGRVCGFESQMGDLQSEARVDETKIIHAWWLRGGLLALRQRLGPAGRWTGRWSGGLVVSGWSSLRRRPSSDRGRREGEGGGGRGATGAEPGPVLAAVWVSVTGQRCAGRPRSCSRRCFV